MAAATHFADLTGPLAYWGPVAPVARQQQPAQRPLLLRADERLPFGDLLGPLWYAGPSRTSASPRQHGGHASQRAA